MSAVSKKVIPSSSALAITGLDALASIIQPKLLQPNPMADTMRPDRPISRCSMRRILVGRVSYFRRREELELERHERSARERRVIVGIDHMKAQIAIQCSCGRHGFKRIEVHAPIAAGSGPFDGAHRQRASE